MSQVPNEVFLSHSNDDHESADRIAGVLTAHGVPVWYSHRGIFGAQQWHDEIAAALHRCDWFMVLLSRYSVESMWVKRELVFALRQRRFDGRILPLLLEDCDYEQRLSWTLPQFQMIDLKSFDDGCRELLRTWGIGYRGSSS